MDRTLASEAGNAGSIPTGGTHEFPPEADPVGPVPSNDGMTGQFLLGALGPDETY